MATILTADFESGVDGDTITTGNTGATTVTGTLTPITISTTYAAAGTRSLRVNAATAFGYANWTLASHNIEYVLIYFVLDATPGATGYPIEVRNGADSAFAYRIGFNTSRQMVITNATTITTTSTFALTNGVEYVFVAVADGAGDLNVSIYDRATASLQEALTPGALTATNFSKFRVGCAASVAGAGLSYHIDHVVVSDSSAPALLPNTIQATLASAMGGLTATATAVVTHEAVMAAPLGTVAATATAVVTHQAVLTAPLGGLTGVATAVVTHEAVMAADLAGLTATATAVVTHEAVLAAPLGGLTGVLVADVSSPSGNVEAVLAAPLGSLDATLTATVVHEAVASADLGGLTAAITATVQHEAVLDAPLGGLTAAATATVQHEAVLASALGGLTAQATAVVTHQAVLAAALGPLLAVMHATAFSVTASPDPDIVDVRTRAAIRVDEHLGPLHVRTTRKIRVETRTDVHVVTRSRI